ncbi:phosphate signaling complex protein PhoU [uncultured Clostridium sp.]|uniref:phosphate signaling complex protein PhoU n=1 Tax=uncultured Clostridium sp. TaxID=59620 RepID=UPI0025F6C6CA|nr:phosphate signaling complex protein PhoU [uncultured Clostridium sp.]
MTRELQNIRVKNIEKDIITMSNLAEKQLYESMLCLKNYDLDKIDSIVKNDDIVDEMQKKIEDECVKFIATEQPLASDLRRVFAASKVVTDLERMADHAVDICKLTKKIGRNVNVFNGSLDNLWDMEAKVRMMIKSATDAYVQNNSKNAYKICEEDDKVDGLCRQLFEDIIRIIKSKEELVGEGAQLLFVIKYLERIADHVTNLCEWTIFSKDGVYVDLNE